VTSLAASADRAPSGILPVSDLVSAVGKPDEAYKSRDCLCSVSLMLAAAANEIRNEAGGRPFSVQRRRFFCYDECETRPHSGVKQVRSGATIAPRLRVGALLECRGIARAEL
jgi:hypothetical protein